METKAYQIEPSRCKGKSFKFADVRTWKPCDQYVYEEKFDGIRYLYQIRPNGAKHNYLTSRHTAKGTGNFVEKQDVETKFRDYKFPAHFSDTVFDGEVVGGKLSSDTQHEMSVGNGSYVVWDILYYQGQDLRTKPLHIRRGILAQLVSSFPPFMRMVEQSESPVALLEKVLDRDGEGIIRKDLSSLYGDKGWSKVKGEETHDVVIWGYEETKSADWKAKGWIGAVYIGQWEEVPAVFWDSKKSEYAAHQKKQHKGKFYFLRDVGKTSGFTNQVRDDISKNRAKHLGMVIEIEYHLRLASGMFRSPRFNRFRHDKNSIDCLYVKP